MRRHIYTRSRLQGFGNRFLDVAYLEILFRQAKNSIRRYKAANPSSGLHSLCRFKKLSCSRFDVRLQGIEHLLAKPRENPPDRRGPAIRRHRKRK